VVSGCAMLFCGVVLVVRVGSGVTVRFCRVVCLGVAVVLVVVGCICRCLFVSGVLVCS